MKRDWNPDEPEWMDRPQPVTPGLRRDLENIGALNRYFGSHKLVRRYLRQWLEPGTTCRVLDLCTGYGDIPRMMIDWGHLHNVHFSVDAADRHPATLQIAREKSAEYPGIRFLQGDALDFHPPEGPLSPPGGLYDLVHCSLSLHHFSEEDAVRLLERCRALSRRWVLVADLERNRQAQLAVWLVTALFYREPMTRHDARLSIRRAFSREELCALALRAGWKNFTMDPFFPVRQALWLEKA